MSFGDQHHSIAPYLNEQATADAPGGLVRNPPASSELDAASALQIAQVLEHTSPVTPFGPSFGPIMNSGLPKLLPSNQFSLSQMSPDSPQAEDNYLNGAEGSGDIPEILNAPTSETSEAQYLDPYASAFLRDRLGPIKWTTFSAKLFERRLGGSKLRASKKKSESNGAANGGIVSNGKQRSGATVIEFLVKTEVVKEVLRTFVPHPYNPLKSLSHCYPPSPSGVVVLTRPALLHLCGWSNTQFSYWARRSEAIACLSQYDERLTRVRTHLEDRLSSGHFAVNLTNEDAKATDVVSQAAIGVSVSTLEDIVTGKGIDTIIEEVKRRTGASQFIRGKHASLDPFGKILNDDFAHGLGDLNAGLETARDVARFRPGGGGGGGVRISDIRKRTDEAKRSGLPVPLEYVRAEEEAARVVKAKLAGKGKRSRQPGSTTSGQDPSVMVSPNTVDTTGELGAGEHLSLPPSKLEIHTLSADHPVIHLTIDPDLEIDVSTYELSGLQTHPSIATAGADERKRSRAHATEEFEAEFSSKRIRTSAGLADGT